MDKQTVINAYLECAVWTNEPHFQDISEYSWVNNVYLADILALLDDKRFRILVQFSGMSDSQLGHDLWLTRNGHGAGFWDRGYPLDIGEELTKYAKSLGSIEMDITDSGELCLQ